MMFPNLEIEAIVQVGDRTRLDASKSYASKGSQIITKVEIEPFTGAGFLDVTGTKPSDWLTDWEYDTAGTQTVSVRLTDNTPVVPLTQTKTKTIEVVSELTDFLFSSDADLTAEEPDILKYVKRGRNSFKDVHREAQRQILQMLDRKGYRVGDRKIEAVDLVDKSEANEMSKYLALSIILAGQRSQVDDVYQQKSDRYFSKFNIASQRQIIGLDLNQDGSVDSGEGVMPATARLIRI